MTATHTTRDTTKAGPSEPILDTGQAAAQTIGRRRPEFYLRTTRMAPNTASTLEISMAKRAPSPAHPAQPVRLSRRGYAKRRGCSATAIRNAIADGRLREALTADGLIDVELADRLLAERTVSHLAARPNVSLEEARRMRLAAAVALLQADVDDLAGTVAPVSEMRLMYAAMAERVGEVTRRHVLGVAESVAGAEPHLAFQLVYDATCDALTEISSTEIIAEPPADATAEEPPDLRPLEAMTHLELKVLKEGLEARRLRIHRDLREGRVARIAAVTPRIMTHLTNTRTNLLAVASRVAPLMLIATPDTARQTLAAELDQALEALQQELTFHVDR